MSYNYTSRDSSSNTTVANELAQDLEKFALTADHIRTCKLAISDQKNGEARGVLYYWEGDGTPGTVNQKAASWAFAQFSPDDTSDYDKGYRKAMEFLNGSPVNGTVLTPEQAAAARVGTANRKDGSFRVTVFYPTGFSGSSSAS